ncbi:MAG: guanylate kinase [Luteitalea sp.]
MSNDPGGGGRLFVVSAPSGTGKTTVVERLVQVVPGLTMSRSYTSREARAGERDGIDYNFVSRPAFEAMVGRGEFLEYADVFGNYYGTRRADAEHLMASGKDVVLVIDVQGAGQVRATGIPLVTIFVLPPSFDVLEQRLRGRGKDSDVAIRRRLDTARAEVAAYEEYEYVVVNDDLDACVTSMRSIIQAARVTCARVRPRADAIVKTFDALPVGPA